jgi:predicted ArsR family transcriptional regulator
MADFERRLDNRSQAYGMEQLLKLIGAPAVAGLPKLMTRDARRLDAMATLVADIGDPATKEAASASLVEIARHVSSAEWIGLKKPEVQAANAASKLAPTEKQLEAQLQQYQEEELFRVFGAMKKVGGRPAVDWLLAFAGDKNQVEKRRQGALAALEGKLDKSKPDDASKLLAIASADAPDVVLDQAFRRAGELPRALVIEKLYELFKTDKWKVRRAAGATALRMSTAKDIGEFLRKLPKGDAKGFAMPEALSYGALIGELKEGDVRAEVGKFLTEGSPAARTTALSYYFSYGTTADLPVVQPLEGDRGNVPVCETDPDCKWSCEVAKEGAADPKEREVKDIKSIGEFVRFCVEPAMRERQLEPKKEEKK